MLGNCTTILEVFESKVAVAFQNIFCFQMHQNNIYFFNFLKIIFDSSISKRSKNIKKLILNKKNSNFDNFHLECTTKHELKATTLGPKD